MAHNPDFTDKGATRSTAPFTEKDTVSSDEVDPSYRNTVSSPPGFWTRMGVTPESFKKRTVTDRDNQLNQTLQSRHLHMIAIGGSIGAGLFVGSGSALSRGVRAALLVDEIFPLTLFRVPEHYFSISASSVS